mgnify:CR=1 FL=1
MTRVGFQGEPGAFSEDAARQLVTDAQPVGYRTFDDLVEAVSHADVDVGLLPIENTIAGPIARSYDLLWDHAEITIIDETVYRVVQCLIGVRGATVDDIKEVRSHPVALEQCRGLLARHPNWSAQIVDDTAGAVRAIVDLADKSVAAIASRLAAEVYHADVLIDGVQDDSENFTRFFLIARDGRPRRQLKRACVALQLAHTPGSLRDALSSFSDEHLNLRSLVSRPARRGTFEYTFYCEVENAEGAALDRALAKINGVARILGRY